MARLIEKPRSRWFQDPEVYELITHLNAEERYDKWGSLTKSELIAIEKEISKCREDFVYAARNYFWVIDDNGNEQQFCLWPSQEIIYETMMDLKKQGKAQKITIIKSRRLGCSTLIEGLVAWSTIFFTNRVGVVVSYDRMHTKNLLEIMLKIYDKLPWWMKPRVLSRTLESGLKFDNPDHERRGIDPGTQSQVMLKSGNAVTGVAQGYRISCAHISEFCDFDDAAAREIIEEDLTPAIQQDVSAFGFLESTAKGANRFAHKFWKRCEELAETSDWYPLFLPWFVDKTHVMMSPSHQQFDRELIEMKERIKDEWVWCDHKECQRYFNRWRLRVDQSDSTCPDCKIGKLKILDLSPEQMAWMQRKRLNAKDDEESQKRLKQEQASTAEEAFQVTGYQVFGQNAQNFANSEVRKPMLTGLFDSHGRVHAVDTKLVQFDENSNPIPETIHCIVEGCKENHFFDECPLRIWELPDEFSRYYIGADVSEGLGGNCDYSVGSVIRMAGQSGIGQTYQVGVWRSNKTSPQDFAEQLNYLGHMYNMAEISVEVNKFDTANTWLRLNCQYPNLYRWKHMDSVNPLTNKIGWFTNQISRPRLHQNFRRFLEYKMFFVRSFITANEMKNFVKDDYDDRTAGADSDTHDDELIATMIALWCAYEGEIDESRGFVPLNREPSSEASEFKFACQSCGLVWYGDRNSIPQMGDLRNELRCRNEKCSSNRITFEQNRKLKVVNPQEHITDSELFEDESDTRLEYWSL